MDRIQHPFYWIVCVGENRRSAVGYLRCDEGYLSYAIAADRRGYGTGPQMIWHAARMIPGPLSALVRGDNQASLICLLANGFSVAEMRLITSVDKSGAPWVLLRRAAQ